VNEHLENLMFDELRHFANSKGKAIDFYTAYWAIFKTAISVHAKYAAYSGLFRLKKPFKLLKIWKIM